MNIKSIIKFLFKQDFEYKPLIIGGYTLRTLNVNTLPKKVIPKPIPKPMPPYVYYAFTGKKIKTK